MTIKNYIIKSFLHYKFKHLAVIIGVVISTSVITGSLIVGDSVKYSLKNIVNHRLGKTDFALSLGEKFVRSQIANEISEKLKVKASSLMLAQGVLKNPENNSTLNKVQILGIDSSFWNLSDVETFEITNDEVIISENTANKLNVSVDDEIILKLEKLSIIPLNSPYNTNDAPYITLRLKIKQIISIENLGNFNLKKNQVAPFNIFISRDLLCEKLDLKDLTNLILINSNNQKNINSETLDSSLNELCQLKDLGLKLSVVDNCYEISSSKIFIAQEHTKLLEKIYKSTKQILSYLVNSIDLNYKSTPYSFVTAVSENLINAKIKSNEIIINDWLAEDLTAKIGDSLSLKYFVIDSLQRLQLDSSRFIVSKIITVSDSIINKSLMPDFPGIGSAVSCIEWNSNMPIDMKKIRVQDEDYWKNYKGTPKAIISISDGKKLWENKFGSYTAIRINKSEFATNEPEKEIVNCLKNDGLNLHITNIRKEGFEASKSGVDFGELFISLSFFVILLGLLLTILLVSLNAESRKNEFGILAQLGFSKNQVIKIILFENSIAIFLGTIIGVFVGIAFNYLIISAINSVWNDIVRTNMISVFIDYKTLLISAFSGLLVSFFSIFLFSHFKLKKSIKLLLSKTYEINYSIHKNRTFWYAFLFYTLTTIAILTTANSLLNSENISPSQFLISGALFLFGLVSFTAFYFNKKPSEKSKFTSLKNLAMLNIRRNFNRNLTIIILLSLGIFIVVITAANRKTFVGETDINSSGTGGYKLMLETSVPIPMGWSKNDFYKTLGLKENIELSAIFSKDGDDASCLNLNQIPNPRIIGVNNEIFNNRQSFSFENISELIIHEKPWLSLNRSLGKNIIPAYADQTVITWGMMKKIGDTLVYRNEIGENLYLVICGGLNSSIFQGNIIISEKHFKAHFPSYGSPKLFLADIPASDIDSISKILNEQLQDYGINIINTMVQLAQFNSVTNTYLSVFMILGALAVLVGTIGLGVVIYRNILDRKSEIALLTSLGFTSNQLFKLLFTENLILVIIGILIGIFASIIGILPSLLSESFNHPEAFVLVLITLIFINCIIWIYIPLKFALKRNLIQSLRVE